MNTAPASNIVTLVSALDEAGMFVILAARTHRANQLGGRRRRQCLCSLFHAAGLCGAQALFVELQQALCADPRTGFVASERGAPRVSRQELLLLGALSHWQRHPGDLSDHAFAALVSPAAARVAAPLAREFARQMAFAGLRLETGLHMVEEVRPQPRQDTALMH